MKKKVAIIVARFQVDELHDGHKKLIQTALDQTDYVIILLGQSKEAFTPKNPLPFYHRKHMILDVYPHTLHRMQILPIDDIPGDDKTWVKALDDRIETLVRPHEEAILYGSRDSFINTYQENEGIHKTVLVEQLGEFNGTEQRASIKNVFYTSRDFRRGIIYTVLNNN